MCIRDRLFEAGTHPAEPRFKFVSICEWFEAFATTHDAIIIVIIVIIVIIIIIIIESRSRSCAGYTSAAGPEATLQMFSSD
eukprot:2624055-Rhodomonas_salina.4